MLLELVLLVVLVLLLVGPLFVFEEGMRWNFFPLFRGPLPLSVTSVQPSWLFDLGWTCPGPPLPY